MQTVDAVVIGAGHNGLVAAAALARAGWSVVVLEAEDEPGGCVRSGEATVPGVVHDLYSTNQNLFRQSPAYQAWKGDLERHGLRFAHSETPFCNVFEDGTALRAYADVDKTLAALAERSAEDAEGFRQLHERFRDMQKVVLPLYGLPLPSAGALAAAGKGAASVGPARTAELARLLLDSTRELGDAYFETPEAKALVATWGMHMDYGPDVSGGAVFPLMETFSNVEGGMVVAEGGASKVPQALVGLIEEHGGTVRTGARVARVLTEDGRATGVEIDGGERITAERAVVANLVPSVLFGQLLDGEPLPDEFQKKVDRYQHGPGTFMLHLALDGPARWAAGDDLAQFAYVHVAPTVDDLARTYQQSRAGLLPDSPLLIVGQTTAVDPSRAPAGTHVLWVQVRTVPGTIRGDAAGEIGAADWRDAREPFAERVLDKPRTVRARPPPAGRGAPCDEPGRPRTTQREPGRRRLARRERPPEAEPGVPAVPRLDALRDAAGKPLLVRRGDVARPRQQRDLGLARRPTADAGRGLAGRRPWHGRARGRRRHAGGVRGRGGRGGRGMRRGGQIGTRPLPLPSCPQTVRAGAP